MTPWHASRRAREEVTQILQESGTENPAATERLIPILYNELRGMASHYMWAERMDSALRRTALVHEAIMRLADQNQWLTCELRGATEESAL